MRGGLTALVDRIVCEAVAEGGLHLAFEGDVSLSIFNATKWSGPASADPSVIVGHRVIKADSGTTAARLVFDDGSALGIDLSDTAFTQPEAMILRLPGEPIVVWN